MIVRDEIEVLKKAFDSVVQHIDYWVIGDTGSEDGTQEFITAYFEDKGIPGELQEDEWVDFAHNRSLVFSRAQGKADYLMTLDADEYIVPLNGKEPIVKKKVKKLPIFKKDMVRIYTHLHPWMYKRAQFFKGDKVWKWAEGLHEYPYCEEAVEEEFIDSFCVYTVGGGSRAERVDRLMKDIATLKKTLKEEPSARNYYNLGMTQQGASEYGEAIPAYQKCIELSEWEEEIYLAHLAKGQCLYYSNRIQEAMVEFARGTEVIPKRGEAYYYLAEQHYHLKQFTVAKIILEAIKKLPFPEEELSLVDMDVYKWKISDVLSLCYHHEGRFKEAYTILKKIVKNKKVTIHDKPNRERLEANFALMKRLAQMPRKYKKMAREAVSKRQNKKEEEQQ
jgi:tetratricopeptide (TPR) repeat protein